tara:strand:+ start:1738 stop:1968 length:231 start_codon:yes stop_codon:yes gene_type:complete
VKVGDYVGKVSNRWQKHNKWLEFPDEPPTPLGLIVKQKMWIGVTCWIVLKNDGTLGEYDVRDLAVIDESACTFQKQ